MTQVTSNGNTYGDGPDAPGAVRNLGGGGFRKYFLNLLADPVATVQIAVAKAAEALGSAGASATSASAAAASETAAQAYAAALHGTSATSLAIGIGARVFETQASRRFMPGRFVEAVDAADPTKWMWGQATAYGGTAPTVDAQAIGGSKPPPAAPAPSRTGACRCRARAAPSARR